GLLEAEASVASSALHPLHHVTVLLRHRHGGTLKLAGKADALHGDGLDARAGPRALFERHAESREDAPPILAPFDQQDDERVLDLAPSGAVDPHHERELCRSLAADLAIEGCLAAELRVRCDRRDDAKGVRVRVRDAPGRAPAFTVS